MGRRTVEAAIMQFHRYGMFCLEAYVRLTPTPRHDNERPDSAKLARHRLVDQRLVARPPRLTLRSRPEKDRVVGTGAARQVDLVNLRMMSQVLANLRTARDHPQETGTHKRGEDRLDQRIEIIVHRVHLQHHHMAAHDHVVDHIEWRNAADVTGS